MAHQGYVHFNTFFTVDRLWLVQEGPFLQNNTGILSIIIMFVMDWVNIQ